MNFFISEQNRLVHKVSFSLYLLAAQNPSTGPFLKTGRGAGTCKRKEKSCPLLSFH